MKLHIVPLVLGLLVYTAGDPLVAEETDYGEDYENVDDYPTNVYNDPQVPEESNYGEDYENVDKYTTTGFNDPEVPEESNYGEDYGNVDKYTTTGSNDPQVPEESDYGEDYENVNKYTTPGSNDAQITEQFDYGEDDENVDKDSTPGPNDLDHVQGELMQDNKTKACSKVRCTLYCRHGLKTDKNGCTICKCKPNACSKVRCKLNCTHGLKTDKNGCTICKCKPHACSKVPCNLRCNHGYKTNWSGCTICKCKPHACSKVPCMQRCSHGYKTNWYGCNICKCKPHVCSKVRCTLHCHNGFQTDKKGCALCKCKQHLHVMVNKIHMSLLVSEHKSYTKVFVQLKMNPTLTHTKFVPENCYATSTKNRYDPYRKYLIRQRVPVARTYVQIVLDLRMFRFSVSLSAAFMQHSGPTYVHCVSRICHSHSRRCSIPRRYTRRYKVLARPTKTVQSKMVASNWTHHKVVPRTKHVHSTKGDEQQLDEDDISDELVHSMVKIEQLRSW